VSDYSTRYCGPDYAVDYYFIATADGRVWVWSAGDGFAEALLALSSAVGAFLAGAIVFIILQIRDRRYESIIGMAKSNEN
jgi:hypothetical protein